MIRRPNVQTLFACVIYVVSATRFVACAQETNIGSAQADAEQLPSTSQTLIATAPDDSAVPVRTDAELLAQFNDTIFPLLANEENGCVDCHSDEGTSNLVLSGNATSDFWVLLDGGYLNPNGPDTLWGRITSANAERRMPKDAQPWSQEELAAASTLIQLIAHKEVQEGVGADERFPRSLLQPYHKPPEVAHSTQFLTYRQLRGKVKTLFDDDWVRGERDFFAENIAMFQGADFKSRFNESSSPSAGYLTALEMLARDVSEFAFRMRTGPFENWTLPQRDPSTAMPSDKESERAIKQLYRRLLFRSPSEPELASSKKLLNEIYVLEDLIGQRGSELTFELSVREPGTEQSRVQSIQIPVSGDALGVQQIVVDQRGDDQATRQNMNRVFRPLINQVVMAAIEQESSLRYAAVGDLVTLRKSPPNGEEGLAQRVVLHNANTFRNVNFASIQIRNAQGDLISSIEADDPQVQLDGAWELEKRDGHVCAEDKNRHKGRSRITIPLSVEKDGQYSVLVSWHADAQNASNVLVELYAEDANNELAVQVDPAPPTIGNAYYWYDCGHDSVAYAQLDDQFVFGDDGYIEISNGGTLSTVTAAAVELVNIDSGKVFLIDSDQAEGHEDWEQYSDGSFRAYNVKGKKLHDSNKKKGKLSLRYLVSSLSKNAEWQPDAKYNVRVYYPGKRNQETHVPVIVHAKRSAPIVQITHPTQAKSDAEVVLDASSTYCVQGGMHEFSWRQISGPIVDLTNKSASRIKFTAPRLNIDQVAWSSLCAALIRHPDFLFTRPSSVHTASSKARQRLKLSKLALDLVGRCPTHEEFQMLRSGTAIETMVDMYLDSAEFQDFYFHRIRLYLESQGGDLQDEPARLWSYIANNDRPFQEILTADYTVDEAFDRVTRPKQHGRTGVLTTKGFIDGKPGLPHYNYAAQVSMLFLGYVYEVPPEIVEQREGVTALGTTDPDSVCYSCHKILTPLSFQRLNWTDDGKYRTVDDSGLEIDATDRDAATDYPFAGDGLEAFAMQAVQKERFIRTIINTHVNFYLGHPLQFHTYDRQLYKKLWDNVHENNFNLRSLVRCIVLSDEYWTD